MLSSMFETYGAPAIDRRWLWALRILSLVFFLLFGTLALIPLFTDSDSSLIVPVMPLLLAYGAILWGLRVNPPGKGALALFLGMNAIPAVLFAASSLLVFDKVPSAWRRYPFEQFGYWVVLALVPVIVAVSALAALARMRGRKNAAPWVWGVRAGVLLSMVMLWRPLRWKALMVWVCQFAPDVMSLLFLLALVLLHAVVLWGLRKPPEASSREASAALWLALGVSACVCGYAALRVLEVLAGGYFYSGGAPAETDFWNYVTPAALTLFFGASTVVAIRVYYLLPHQANERYALARGFGGAVVCLVLAAMLMPSFIDGHRRGSANETAAVGTLRDINTVEITYAQTYGKGFSRTLAELGPPPSGTPSSATAADLIDSVLASGTKSGFAFTYSPGPADGNGRITAYMILARPIGFGKSGRRNFFTDQSGVIRATREDRPATAGDNPL